MINNNNNIFGGNGYMRGGVKPPGVSFDESTVITNDDILYYYFKKPTDPSFKPSVDNSDKLIFRDERKAEFIENQVKIVEYMLDRNHTQYGGGMYGGGELEDAKVNLATEQAKYEQDQDKDLIARLQAKITGLEAANADATSAAAAAAAAVESAASKPAAAPDANEGLDTSVMTLEESIVGYLITGDIKKYKPSKKLLDDNAKTDVNFIIQKIGGIHLLDNNNIIDYIDFLLPFWDDEPDKKDLIIDISSTVLLTKWIEGEGA
jgi:hypothetical protein